MHPKAAVLALHGYRPFDIPSNEGWVPAKGKDLNMVRVMRGDGSDAITLRSPVPGAFTYEWTITRVAPHYSYKEVEWDFIDDAIWDKLQPDMLQNFVEFAHAS